MFVCSAIYARQNVSSDWSGWLAAEPGSAKQTTARHLSHTATILSCHNRWDQKHGNTRVATPAGLWVQNAHAKDNCTANTGQQQLVHRKLTVTGFVCCRYPRFRHVNQPPQMMAAEILKKIEVCKVGKGVNSSVGQAVLESHLVLTSPLSTPKRMSVFRLRS